MTTTKRRSYRSIAERGSHPHKTTGKGSKS